jgi:hypothetical protein
MPCAATPCFAEVAQIAPDLLERKKKNAELTSV